MSYPTSFLSTRFLSSKFLLRFLAPAMVSAALVAAPVLSAAHAAGDDSAKRPVSSKQDRRVANPDDGYRSAYSRLGAALLATIYDRRDYTAAIGQLKALDRDDDPAVATLLGYSYRKLGDYEVAQVWYERALRADPNHVKTWQYYGMWQLEQGNREQAQFHLNKIAQLAGTDSEAYRSLAAALEQAPGTGLVY